MGPGELGGQPTEPPRSHSVEIVRHRLDPHTTAQVLRLVSAAAAADAVEPLSEHVALHLRYGGDAPTRNVLVRSADGELLGYAHLDVTDLVEGASAELVIHPLARRQGCGRAVVEALLDEVATTDPNGRLRLWAHGALPAAHRLADSLGFRRTRRLLQMRRGLTDALPQPRIPPGIHVRAYRDATDDAAWLRVNALAFAMHPEQGGWTETDLLRRRSESWFDPAGLFLAERDARLVGFHWTKVHGGTDEKGAGPERDHGHAPIGEVYVLGVDPQEQGQGLGRALTIVGLNYLRDLGLEEAMLYVEADNRAANAVYESLGFVVRDSDTMYSTDARMRIQGRRP